MRSDFGTGRSSTWNELGGFNSIIDDTKRTWDEFCRVIPKMWTEERFSYNGTYFSMPERAVLPKPMQDPHPPLWVAVTAVGTAMMAPQDASFFITVFSRASCSDRLVSKTELTMSRSDSVHSAARRTWS